MAYATITHELAEKYPIFRGRVGESVTAEDIAKAKGFAKEFVPRRKPVAKAPAKKTTRGRQKRK